MYVISLTIINVCCELFLSPKVVVMIGETDNESLEPCNINPRLLLGK